MNLPEFPSLTTPSSVSRREQAIIALLILVVVASTVTFLSSRSAGKAARGANTAVEQVRITQEVNRVVGIGNRAVSCLLLEHFQPNLPAVCLTPEVVAASDGQLKAR